MTNRCLQKRISFLCTSLRAGGTERVISTIANHLAEHYDVQIILLTRDASFYPLDSRITVSTPGISKSEVFSLVYYLKMLAHVRSAIKRHRSGVVLSFGEAINSFGLISTVFLGGKKIVFNRANPWSSLSGIRGILNPVVYPLANRVVVQTNSAKRILSQRYRFCNFAVIANPVKIPEGIPQVLERRKVVISVGYLGGKKNQAGLIRVFASAAASTAWSLRIVGDGPGRSSLESLAQSLGIQDQVSFLGERRDISQLLMDSQVFAFTSLSEGFPNALAEAMAHGCACISFDCPTGPAELITHGVNGLLVPPGDERHYQRELSCLLNDEALRERFGKQARLEMSKYSLQKVLRQFERLILASRN